MQFLYNTAYNTIIRVRQGRGSRSCASRFASFILHLYHIHNITFMSHNVVHSNIRVCGDGQTTRFKPVTLQMQPQRLNSTPIRVLIPDLATIVTVTVTVAQQQALLLKTGQRWAANGQINLSSVVSSIWCCHANPSYNSS